MSILLYCIFRTGDGDGPAGIKGVNERPVLRAATDVLVAAYSELDPADLIANVERALKYQEVIEKFHSTFTVIPARYGSAFDSTAALTQMLAERQSQLLSALERLEGCVEMGIRIVTGPSCTADVELPGAPPPADQSSPGRAYLLSRKELFDRSNLFQATDQAAQGRVSEHFEGLYTDLKLESNPGRIIAGADVYRGRRVTSLYFLVRRTMLAEFQLHFHELERQPGPELLLSGPWPPYNFVSENLSKSD